MTNTIHTRTKSITRYMAFVITLVLITIGRILLWNSMTNETNYLVHSERAKDDIETRSLGKPVYYTSQTNSRYIHLSEKTISSVKRVGGIGFTFSRPTSLGMTTAKSCRYWVSNSERIKLGDLIKVNIEARDANERLRTSGGDYFSVLIIQDKRNASTAAHIIDHKNGTYTAYAYAGWSGKSRISLKLVHPSDAIMYLRFNYTLIDHRAGFVGIFKKKNITEKSKCVIQFEGSWKNKCEYFHPTGLFSTRLICDPPPSLSCDTLTVLPRSDDTNALNKPMLPKEKQYLFDEYHRYQNVTNGPRHVVILGEKSKQTSIASSEKCTTPDLPTLIVDGYWMRNRYHLLGCNNTKWFTFQESKQCLRNKHLLLLGDSQLRLWIRKIKLLFNIPIVIDKYTHAVSVSHPPLNFNASFQFHPYFRHPEEGYSLVSDHRFESQILDDLDYRHCDYIVVFGPWAHYALWLPDAYRERLEFLRDGILRFMKRCPDAPVILKGPQPTKTTSTFFDYICESMMMIQREAFRGIGVRYMNSWDMIQSAFWYEDPHPPDDILTIQFQQLLSFSCDLES